MKHYIIVKFITDYNYKNELDNIIKLFDESKKIFGVESVNIYCSNSNRDNRHDIMIEMILSKEGLENFDNSDIHRNWKELYGKYISSKTIFDCDK